MKMKMKKVRKRLMSKVLKKGKTLQRKKRRENKKNFIQRKEKR
jgi:hypothetical protein